MAPEGRCGRGYDRSRGEPDERGRHRPLVTVEFGLHFWCQFDGQRSFDEIAFGGRDPGSAERVEQVAPRQAWRAMERWVAAKHLVDGVFDVVKVGAVFEKDEPVGRFLIFGQRGSVPAMPDAASRAAYTEIRTG